MPTLRHSRPGPPAPSRSRDRIDGGIKNLQTVLNKLGLLEGQYITGHHGSITTDAVKRFQEQNGLPVTGSFGPLTRANILERMQ
ncbi:MAG: peptidoglycan-binding domain-containing protein [Syntrophobacteraceae bacterium]